MSHRDLMKMRRFRRSSVLSLLALLVAGGCNYSFRGGSFPDHIRTLAVVPFENETTRLELTQEIHTVMLQNLPGALGVSSGGEEFADAVVEGTITAYNVTTPNYRPDPSGNRAEVLQREVVVTASVRIVDRVRNVILWEELSLRGEGQYLEASETEDVGKQEALELLIQRIVDGAQSNW